MKLKITNGYKTISSPYGLRLHPIKDTYSFHNGVDIPLVTDTPLLAEDDGVIVVSRANKGNPKTGYGWYMVVQYDGYSILYAHLQPVWLPVGTKLKKDEIFAYSGNSGSSTGPHLHLEVRLGTYDWRYFKTDGYGRYLNSVDPETFIPPNDIPDWEDKIRHKMDDPDYWIKFGREILKAGEESNDQRKYFDEFVMKL